MAIFTSASAQEENIGDMVLRRTLIEWLGPFGSDVHIYVGRMPDSYVAGLGITKAVVYRSLPRWTFSLMRDAFRGQARLVFAPGAQALRLNRGELVHAVLNLLLVLIIKSRGGKVFKVARSLDGGSQVLRVLERWLSKMANGYWLRDSLSPVILGREVELVPDLAASVVSSTFEPGDLVPSADAQRTVASFSWRGDRKIPDGLFECFVERCSQLGLEPVLVTQVWTDDYNHAALAKAFGLRHVSWTDRDHVSQLLRVEEIYGKSKLVVSNRLHALIIGWNCGAAPVGVHARGDMKIRNHMDLLGISEYAVSPDRLFDALDRMSDFATRESSVSRDAHARVERQLSTLRRRLISELGCPSRDVRTS